MTVYQVVNLLSMHSASKTLHKTNAPIYRGQQVFFPHQGAVVHLLCVYWKKMTLTYKKSILLVNGKLLDKQYECMWTHTSLVQFQYEDAVLLELIF